MTILLKFTLSWLVSLAVAFAHPATPPPDPAVPRLAAAVRRFFRAEPARWRIEAIVAAGRAYGVEPEAVAALCALESGVGLNPRGARIWCGAMRAAPDRQPFAAARALRQWRDRCRSPLRALVAWRWGNGCRAPDPTRYAVRATALAARFAAP